MPNVSEGRHEPTIRALVAACAVPGARVLRADPDPDHNRTVITIAGAAMAVQEALVRLAAACVELIDLRWHEGVHPRLGALDVAPIVALTPEGLPLALELAGGLVERLGWELDLPVFTYAESADTPERRRPHQFRVGGLEGLAREMAAGNVLPSAGPPRLHPTAGAVLVGARLPLVAINVWLPEGSVTEAKVIAARVRETGGGLPGVRALGLWLESRGVAQVSMNIEDTFRTPVAAALGAVRREAERIGVEAGDAELIGLVPRHAIGAVSPASLRIARFTPARIVEFACPALAVTGVAADVM